MLERAKLFTVSSPPHWHCGRTVRCVMYNYLLALLPAVVMSVVFFNLGALRVIAMSCFTAVVVEALCRKAMKREITVFDGSALLTGILFAFLMPASAPWWLVIAGCATAIIVGKQVFGGLGGNPLPPALVGWAVLKLSWAAEMSFDQSMLGTAMEYPLAAIRLLASGEPVGAVTAKYSYMSLLLGNQLGPLGGVQVLALVIGGIYLVARGFLKPHIPAAFLVSIIVVAGIFNIADPAKYADPIFHLLTGSVVLGAFFLATDFSSVPVNRIAMLIYGALAGALVVVIRTWGVYPDGVPFAILLASLSAPLIDRIRPRVFGGKAK